MTEKYNALNASENAALDDLFEQARGQIEPPRDDFMSRVLADAADVTAARAEPAAQTYTKRRKRGWQIFKQFGGWSGASLITACAVFGVALGYAGPDSLYDLPGMTELGESLGLDVETDLDMFQTGFEFASIES